MRESTLTKLREIQQMRAEGISESEIIKKKFKGSAKLYGEWMKKFGNNSNQVSVVENPNPLPVNFLQDKKALENFQNLLENVDKILELINRQEDEVQEIYILDPEKVEEFRDIKTMSVRVSETLDKQFTEFVKGTTFSKVQLLNLMYFEFLQKYAKK